MATRLKTVKTSFPALASLVNNTLTNLTQITVYLPETGTKTFRSVVAHITMNDVITATGGTVTTKTFSLRLGAAAYTTVANANALTNTGENASHRFAVDFTSHFTTNWTGSSMTCDFQATVNQSTGTTLGMVNVCVTLDITYEYDDTSTTHIKTVLIPLNAPVGAIATVATTYDTIPALDTYLPEASKVYRNIHLVIQGNEHRNAATTDHTLTLRVGSATQATGLYVGALASDRMFRYVWDLTAAYPSKAATQTFQPTADVARVNHFQAYLVVTYEFDATTTTTVMNSVMLPMEVTSPMGGTGAGDYQRGSRELWIQETSITAQRIAFFPFWQQIAAIAGLNMRIGTGSFVAYTDAASVTCGGNAAMVRNDAAFTLARGRNSLNFDIYRTDTADFGWNVSGFWLVNYTSAKHADGVGAHNHTVEYNLAANGTAASAVSLTTSALAVQIPETAYLINALGVELIAQTTSGVAPSGFTVLVERLSAEGGIEWEELYVDLSQTDPEVGWFVLYAQMRTLFKRWVGDPESGRIDIETARRWRVFIGSATTSPAWFNLSVCMTYHTIDYTVAGTVDGFTGDGSGITVEVYRTTTDDKVGEAVTSVGGGYTFNWYDNTEQLYTVARQDGTHMGRSDNAVAV